MKILTNSAVPPVAPGMQTETPAPPLLSRWLRKRQASNLGTLQKSGSALEKEAAATQLGTIDRLHRFLLPRNDKKGQSIEDRNYSHLASLLSGDTKVTFISSFPRSGNTWTRFLLSDVFLQRAGMTTKTELAVPVPKIIPDIYIDLIAEYAREIAPSLVVKTHEGFDRLMRHLPGAAKRQCRHIYIFRSAEDALISFYRFHARDEQLKHKAQNGKDSFCRTRIRDWISNAGGYVRAVENGSDVYFVSYEQLLERTEPVLSGILDWLGVDYNESMVQRAVSNMKFDNLVKEAQRGQPAKGEFTGRGCPGAGAAELSAETVDLIRQKTAAVSAQLNRFLARQNDVGRSRGPGAKVV